MRAGNVYIARRCG